MDSSELNEKSVMEEYEEYERKKIFIDNITRTENPLAWIMDEDSVYVSENGDGGIYSIAEVEIEDYFEIGDVFENINDEYVFNERITEALKSC